MDYTGLNLQDGAGAQPMEVDEGDGDGGHNDISGDDVLASLMVDDGVVSS